MRFDLSEHGVVITTVKVKRAITSKNLIVIGEECEQLNLNALLVRVLVALADSLNQYIDMYGGCIVVDVSIKDGYIIEEKALANAIACAILTEIGQECEVKLEPIEIDQKAGTIE